MSDETLFPFAVTFTDGYYAVVQATDKAHARDKAQEHHSGTIQQVREVR